MSLIWPAAGTQAYHRYLGDLTKLEFGNSTSLSPTILYWYKVKYENNVQNCACSVILYYYRKHVSTQTQQSRSFCKTKRCNDILITKVTPCNDFISVFQYKKASSSILKLVLYLLLSAQQPLFHVSPVFTLI
jgi:hypothetical protein